MSDRIETGKLQVGDDWPGVFIRGDNALLGYAPALRAILNGDENEFHRAHLRGLLNVLEEANAHNGKEPQRAALIPENADGSGDQNDV
jgi:hypothetical protein